MEFVKIYNTPSISYEKEHSFTMKLKYKKVILLTTLCTMGIGLLTLSISQSKPRAQDIKADDGIVASQENDNTGNVADTNDNNRSTMTAMAHASEVGTL